MKRFALIGNPNAGKTTLFNTLTGSTAHVGNWPGVTVDKKVGIYKGEEEISIIDLPGIYSLSPYSPEELISRDYILEEKPECIINIVDATNLERNLYLTTQLLEIDIPVVVALNMMDVLRENGDILNSELLEKRIGCPVIEISAQTDENIDLLMKRALEEANKKRKGTSLLENGPLSHLVNDIKIAFELSGVDNPLFHAVKLVENDEVEVKNHPQLISTVDQFKQSIKDDIFGSDLEAIVADARYKYITQYFSTTKVVNLKHFEDNKSQKIDKVLTHKIFGLPIFLLILFLIFHLTFSKNLFYLGSIFNFESSSFEGTLFEGVLWTDQGINSPGVILANLMANLTDGLGGLISGGLESINAYPWLISLVNDGILAGIFAVLSFVPQILVLFLLFSILEDSGYMARVAFILDRIFRKFGLSGRAFFPMIMGFGCSVPAIMNTRTLSDDNERTATIRVIPFFSCGTKLPILTAIAGAIVNSFGLSNPDIITYSMYLLGITVAICSVLLMKHTTLKGDIPPFIMELPDYRAPKFSSLMLLLWDKFKHYIEKAFTIILASTIIIWFLSSFDFNYNYLLNAETGAINIQNSILANIAGLFAPIFTPLGFGSQLSQGLSWIFVAAAVTGLIAKENVIATFTTIATCLVSSFIITDDGVLAVVEMVKMTGIGIPGLISFIAFNMLTIPCFATVAAAKGELSKKKFIGTLIFWIVISYVVSMMIYTIGTWWYTSFIYAGLIGILVIGIIIFNRRKTVSK